MPLVVTAAILGALCLAGCSPNAGTAFGSEFEQYLESRDDVADFTVRGHNDAPFRGSADSEISLVRGLDDARIAQVAAEIADQPLPRSISHHRITLYFDAVNASGAGAAVSVAVPPGADDAARYREQIGSVRSLAADDPGLVQLRTTSNSLLAQTEYDPFVTAELLSGFLREAPADVDFVLVERDGREFVGFDTGDNLDELLRMRRVIAAVPEEITPRRWSASSRAPLERARLEIVLPPGTDPSVLDILYREAVAAGVELDATTAR